MGRTRAPGWSNGPRDTRLSGARLSGDGLSGEEPVAIAERAAGGARPRPGAGALMTARPSSAPRAASLLTAAMAVNSERAGVITASDAMSDEWNGYGQDRQREILIALGAQARAALQMARDKCGTRIVMDWDEAARVLCAEAFRLVRTLVTSEEEPGVMPECAHCREIVANGLCSLQIQAYLMLGITPSMIAVRCGQSAGAAGLPGAAHPAGKTKATAAQ